MPDENGLCTKLEDVVALMDPASTRLTPTWLAHMRAAAEQRREALVRLPTSSQRHLNGI